MAGCLTPPRPSPAAGAIHSPTLSPYEADHRFTAMYLLAALILGVVHLVQNRGEQLAELQVKWAMRLRPLAARFSARVRALGGRAGAEPPAAKTAAAIVSHEPRRATSASGAFAFGAGGALPDSSLHDVLAAGLKDAPQHLPSAPGGFGLQQPEAGERERRQPLLHEER